VATTPSKEPLGPNHDSIGVGLDAAALVDVLFEQSQIGMTVVDRNLRYTHVNDAFGMFQSQNPADIVGKTISEALPQIASYLEPATARVLESGEAMIGQEIVIGDPDDTENARWFRANRYPVVSAAGEIIGVASMVIEITDLKHSLTRDREQRQVLDAIFAAAPVAITLADRDGRYVRVNQSAAANWGLEPDAMAGCTPREILPAAAARKIEDGVRAVVETGQPVLGQAIQGEMRGGARDVKHWLSSRYPIKDGKGQIVGVATIAADVTELRAAQARLDEALARERESRQLLDTLFETSPIAITVVDRDLRYVRVNGKAADDAGMGAGLADMVGRTPRDVFAPVYAEQIESGMRAVLASGEPRLAQPVQGEWPSGSGRFRYWLSSRYPLRDADGEVAGVATIAVDVTELREAQARLDDALSREQEARTLLDALFDTAPVAITFVDRDLRYVRINAAAAANWGLSPSDMVGKRPDEMLPAEFASHIQERFRDVLRSGKPDIGQSVEVEWPAGSGRIQHWLSSRYPVRDVAGEIIGVATVATNVTELRELEAKLAEMLAREQDGRRELEAAKGELAEKNDRLVVLASTDALTGLPNRTSLWEHLTRALARARRASLSVAAIYIDLDGFKEVNDQHGHAIGDALLRAVAERLRIATRGSDLTARLGGDEFLVLLVDLEPEPAQQIAQGVADRFHRALEEPFSVRGLELRVSASIGISIYPADAADETRLLGNADAAMYASKRAEPGRTVFYESLQRVA
jgi:diguanylate cyclase (GGDEF)-like protein/PAS domain S-box-containing protein